MLRRIHGQKNQRSNRVGQARRLENPSVGDHIYTYICDTSVIPRQLSVLSAVSKSFTWTVRVEAWAVVISPTVEVATSPAAARRQVFFMMMFFFALSLIGLNVRRAFGLTGDRRRAMLAVVRGAMMVKCDCGGIVVVGAEDWRFHSSNIGSMCTIICLLCQSNK